MRSQKIEAQHITILAHSLNAGGAQKRLAALANGFAAAGRTVEFVAISDSGIGALNLAPEVRQVVLTQGPRPRRIPRLVYGRRALEEHLKRTKPDVLVAGVTNVHLVALLAARALEHRPALILRASRHPDRDIPWGRPRKRLKNLWRRPLDYWLYDQADRVIAVSGEVGDALRAKMCHPERCIILPNPVVTEAFARSLDRDPPHPWLRGQDPVIVGVGRLVWQKSFSTLVEAMAMVLRNRPAKLILIGEGKLRAELEDQVTSLGIGEHVALPGHVGEVGPWIKHSELLVSSSNFEGSPGVLIEALAAGCPVVATRCPGGSAELLADGVGGVLVPIGDPAEMAAAIAQMLQQNTSRKKLPALAEPYDERHSIAAYLDALDSAEAQVRRDG